jgi:hypothetical protein
MQTREEWYEQQRRLARAEEQRMLDAGYNPTAVAATKALGLMFGWLVRGGWLLLVGALVFVIWMR